MMAVGLNSAIFSCMWLLLREEKLPATQSKLVFSQEVFLRCRTDSAFIKVELAPESNNVFKVAYVSFSCFTFSSTKVIGIKVTGSIFCLLLGWLCR